jgi:MYXO-CTERM domain-containing protein
MNRKLSSWSFAATLAIAGSYFATNASAKENLGAGTAAPSGSIGTTGVAAGWSDSRSRERHPKRFSPVQRPAGVPEDFVLTHNGFFHPSCVFTIHSDETVSQDGTIRGLDGREHDRIPKCAHDRYDRNGQRITRRLISESTPSVGSIPAHLAHGYDGWIVDYLYIANSIPGATSLSTYWTVPAAPTSIGTQDVAFFNDICTTNDGTNLDILQPVLDYNGGNGYWLIESEHCCINDGDVQTSGTKVSVGDTILGKVTGSGCNSTGACSTWVVVTTDVTTSKTETLTVTNALGYPREVHPAVLETYDITSCSMLPASGAITFYDNTVTNSSGVAQSFDYNLEVMTSASYPAGFPRCGYNGTSSGNSYTLIFGTNVGGNSGTGGAAGTAGRPSAGGTSAKATGGVNATGGMSATGGNKATGGAPSSGGMSSAKATGGVNATGGMSATGGNKATGGAPSSGGMSTAGGTPGTGGVSAIVSATSTGGGTNPASTTTTGGMAGSSAASSVTAGATSLAGASHGNEGGCSCRSAGHSRTPQWPALGLLSALVLGRTRRRRRDR